MKEATGELNMTVITVVAIVAVGGLFTAFVWPSIRRSIRLNSACSAAGNTDYSDDDIVCKNRSGVTKCELTQNGKKYSKVCDTNTGKDQNQQ